MSSCNNYIINSKKYNHLSDFERGKIEVLLKESKSIRYIAQTLNRSVSTISREIIRNSVEQIKNITGRIKKYKVYDPFGASQNYLNRRKLCVKYNLLDKNFSLKTTIERFIKIDKYSPEIISYILKEKGINISFKTIYNYSDKKLIDVSRIDFRFRAKRKYKNLDKSNKETRYIIPEEKRITNRPDYINNKENFGHWEGDLVIGQKKGDSWHLLTLVERKTLTSIIMKIHGKYQTSVINALDKIELYYNDKFKDIFKSITFDNGIEFRNYEGLENSKLNEKSKRTTIYYGAPYKSNDRAINENTNGLIRIHFPKGTNFNDINNGEIQKIEDWINCRPRKTLNFEKSKNLFYKNLQCI